MSWSRSDFSRHYKRIIAEGPEPQRLLDRCLLNRLHIRNIKYLSETKVLLEVSKKDFGRLQELAGSRYLVRVQAEGGYMYRLSFLRYRKALLAGLVLFAGLFFYQSLFIAEIEISGYEAIDEQSLRETMKEAGLYEGCRKNIDVSKVKLHMFEEHDNISWIGIKYKGNLAQVTIAETDALYEKDTVKDTSPCNIVADRSGYINSVDPEEGLRAVEDGQYVREGDVLISGAIPLTKSTYEEEDEAETISYVHAAGAVDAKVPVRVNFYQLPYETVKTETGRKMVTVSINGYELLGTVCSFEASTVKRITLCNFVKPVKLKIQINYCCEVKLSQKNISDNAVKKQVINEIHQYVEEKLPDNTQILNKSLNFAREKNIINIGVTLETLQEIGKEEEIIVDKSNGKTEKDDNQ